jgi:hypothetical protein
MIYEQSEITELLNCEHCTQPYDEYYPPRILPCCEKTICYKCVQLTQSKVKDNNFKCIACNQDEKIPSNGFIVNRAVVRLIAKQPKEISRGQEAEKLKENIREVENLNNKLVFEMGNGEYLITEDCKELRRQVQLAKEIKMQQLEKLSDSMLDEIDDFEKVKLNEHFKKNKDEFLNRLKEEDLNKAILKRVVYTVGVGTIVVITYRKNNTRKRDAKQAEKQSHRDNKKNIKYQNKGINDQQYKNN